ncbi:DTW domain-containing protein YfiP [Polaromonas sp. YR568]|uniref:tRNA-uridine aminocarboxypropyltransferase n=1 Tax=Polaromonas sp. YR568 TaxID=1855301 RepID=UPI0008F11B55|nr:tRNA-uridine aminocarboxypropyltransferase [Polaromonas sp. YR568]SFU85998.1 DTW domain-containing protein YfiP [Polaromonas sp. YR568]
MPTVIRLTATASTDAETLPVTRPRCAACLRPQSACICAWVTPVAHAADVLILQHPLEVDHAKNSARLLHLSLPRSRMLTGEAFDEGSLQDALKEPRYNVLLYPQTPGDEAPALDTGQLKDPSRVRLVVLDGTWRKSRKMLHLSPWLRQLPRLALDDVPASNYLIRKTHKPGQLSTLEAACAALAQLEGDAGKYQPLLKAFDGFVAQQLAFVPK